MKKSVANTSSKLKPSNFVRRVLSRTSTSKASLEADEADEKLLESSEKSSVSLESELHMLKKQIDGLQHTVQSMQHETERKERALAKLAKEKEQLVIELKKQKRSNYNLRQQLEDERSFYYKEKEQYCRELKSFKKFRQQQEYECAVSSGDLKELQETKASLKQALEANYNLSVKFLRMKNTKLSIKNQLSSLKEVHQNVMEDFQIKLDYLQSELNNIVSQQMMTPIPPSSKKYLQLVKYSGSLIHDNLALRNEIDNLQFQLDRFKMLQDKSKTNAKLQYIHHNKKSLPKIDKQVSANIKDIDSVRTIATTTTESILKSSLKTDSRRSLNSSDTIKFACLEEHIDNKQSSKSDTISDVNTESTTSIYQNAYRTQSAPEIVQTVTPKT